MSQVQLHRQGEQQPLAACKLVGEELLQISTQRREPAIDSDVDLFQVFSCLLLETIDVQIETGCLGLLAAGHNLADLMELVRVDRDHARQPAAGKVAADKVAALLDDSARQESGHGGCPYFLRVFRVRLGLWVFGFPGRAAAFLTAQARRFHLDVLVVCCSLRQ